MQLLDRAALGGMTKEQLEEHIRELVFEKQSVDLFVSEVHSGLGQRILKRWHEQLDEVRRWYIRIKTIEKDDHEVVKQLVANQILERRLVDDIENLEKAVERKKVLDEYHALCEVALRQRRESARVRR